MFVFASPSSLSLPLPPPSLFPLPGALAVHGAAAASDVPAMKPASGACPPPMRRLRGAGAAFGAALLLLMAAAASASVALVAADGGGPLEAALPYGARVDLSVQRQRQRGREREREKGRKHPTDGTVLL